MRVRIILAAVLVMHVATATRLGGARAAGNDPAEQAYLSANGMLNRGLYELAAAEYRAFIENNPDHAKVRVARYGLGVSLFRMKQFGPAVKSLSPLYKDAGFAFAAEVGTILGQAYLADKLYDEAAAAFTWVVRNRPDHDLADEAGAGLAEALYLGGHHTDAVDACKEFVSRHSDSPLRARVTFFWGLSAMGGRAFGDAAEQFAVLLERYPKSPFVEQSSLLLAQCRQQDGSMAQAIRQYGRIVERAKSKYLPDALLGLATLLQQAGQPEQAGRHLDRLLQRYPKSPLLGSARFQRARAWFDLNKYGKAQTMFKQVVDRDDALADEATYWMAKCALRMGKFEEAAGRLDGAIDRYADSPLIAEMYYDRAIAHVRSGNLEAARPALESFLGRFPEHRLAPDAMHLLAVNEHQQQQFDESRRNCRIFLDRYASHDLAPSIAFLAAENDFLSKRYEEAEKGFRAFLKQYGNDPQVAKAAFRLGTTLYRLDRFDDAVTQLRLVVSGNDADDMFRPALMMMGDILFQRGAWDKAEGFLTGYLAKGFDVAGADDALLKLGLSQQRQEKHAAAIKTFERLINRFSDSPFRLQAMFERGQVLVAMDRTDDAVTAFEAVLKEQRDSRFAPHALNHLAAIATKRGAFDEAAALFARVNDSAGESGLGADAMLQNALALMSAKRFAEAEGAFDKFLSQYGSHSRVGEARAQRAIALSRQDRHEDAIAAIKSVEQQHSRGVDGALLTALQYEKAWCLRELGRSEQAAAVYDALAKSGSAGDLSVHASLELAGIYFAASDYEAATPTLRQLHKRILDDPTDVPDRVREQAMYRLTVCEFKLQRFGEAAALCDMFVDAFPDSSLLASVSFYGGEALFRIGKVERAVKHLSRVVEQFPKDPVYASSLLRLGESFAVLHRWGRSERVFVDYLERFSDSDNWFQAQFGIGWARENQKRHDEAVSAYKKVVARHQGPTAARAQFQIGECLFAKKRYEEAVRELLKVDILYAYPEWSAAALYEAARCFEKLGKQVEARHHFKKVAEGYADTRWAALASQRLSELTSAMIPGK